MKKLIGLILLAVVFLPVFAFAAISIDGKNIEAKPQRCCQIKHLIFIQGIDKFERGSVVAAPGINSGTDECLIGGLGSDFRNTPFWAGLCALDGVMTISEIILWIGVLAVACALVFAGIMYVTAAGSPERIKLANEIFKYSLIGVLVAVLSRFIPAVARYFLGI